MNTADRDGNGLRKARWLLLAAGFVAVAALGVYVLGPWGSSLAGDSAGRDLQTSAMGRDGGAAGRAEGGLEELLSKKAEQLTGIDVGRMNLLCAPSFSSASSALDTEAERMNVPRAAGQSADLDVEKLMARLEAWAGQVRSDVLRARAPGLAAESYEGQLLHRLTLIVDAVGRLGVRTEVPQPGGQAPWAPEKVFLHGVLAGGPASRWTMPVLVAAIARRLGESARLVRVPGGGVLVRLESAAWRLGEMGERQRRFACDVSDGTVRLLELRRPIAALTGAQELALFLSWRGHCLLGQGKLREAVAAYGHARRLSPGTADYTDYFAMAVEQASGAGMARGPNPDGRPDPMAYLRQIQQLNQANQQRMGQPIPHPAIPFPPGRIGDSPSRGLASPVGPRKRGQARLAALA